jgi:diguanylate cyclase (GGDEF)-like protein
MDQDRTLVRPPDAGEHPAGGHCLVFVAGEGALGRSIALDGELVLGRDAACAVPLAADDVSRRHARVAPEGGGHVLVDLDSTNGTFVNGRRVGRHRLAPGDRVQVGPFVARYLRAGDAEAAALAALADLAQRDPLTGLANRRAFEEALRREVARARRSGAPLAVAALDVDHFKRVNDAHGHAAGDAVLAAVAARAAAALRAGDLLARVGGEEFAALLPGAGLAAAVEVAGRVRAAIAGAPVEADGRPVEVTASLGCAALEPADEDGAALLARADARLYQAKRAGRDRVVS